MNARDNPFAAENISAIEFRFANEQRRVEFLQRLEQSNWRGAIVGPQGTGKSTLLAFIDQLAKAQQKSVIIIDSAEQIPYWRWLLTKHTIRGPLIIATHKPGRLQTLYSTGSSQELLSQFIEELSKTRANPEFVRTLYARHGGNIRDALREMYERCAADDTSWNSLYNNACVSRSVTTVHGDG